MSIFQHNPTYQRKTTSLHFFSTPSVSWPRKLSECSNPNPDKFLSTYASNSKQDNKIIVHDATRVSLRFVGHGVLPRRTPIKVYYGNGSGDCSNEDAFYDTPRKHLTAFKQVDEKELRIGSWMHQLGGKQSKTRPWPCSKYTGKQNGEPSPKRIQKRDWG